MKLGEGGEAFFVFETTENVPAALQTSPLVSPASSPKSASDADLPSSLQEPPDLDLDTSNVLTIRNEARSSNGVPIRQGDLHISKDLGVSFIRCSVGSLVLTNCRNHNSAVTVTKRIDTNSSTSRIF
jgi:hypothetical protein